MVIVLLKVVTVQGQTGEKHILEGKLSFCYPQEVHQHEYDYYNATVRATGLDGQGLYYPKRTDSKATVFRFEQLPAGKYKVEVSALGQVQDTVMELKTSFTRVQFCLDRAFRPVESKYLEEYRAKAKDDIAQGRAKIITLLEGSISQNPKLNQKNRRLKRKFGFSYEIQSCSRIIDLRENFVFRKQIDAYNQTVMAFLDEKYGDKWRKHLNLQGEEPKED